MIDFDGVVDKTDLVALVEQAGFSMRKMGSEYRCACPLHNGSNPSGFAVYKKSGKWHWACFTGDCGNGDAIDFVKKLYNITIQEAIEYLGGKRVDSIDPEVIQQRKAKRDAEEAEERERLRERFAQYSTSEIWKALHLRMTDENRAWWEQQGIPREWQDYWRLGYTPDKLFEYDGNIYHSPAYTIPKFEFQWVQVNTDYRLTDYPEGAGKYRMEVNMPAAAFISYPHHQQFTDEVFVVEGSKKAMVTALYTAWNTYRTVIGLPAKKSWAGMDERLRECGRVWVIPDPDAEREGYEFAKSVGDNARVVCLPAKIDDAINSRKLDWRTFESMLRYARKA